MPDGDQGRWLSYQELGDVLGCTANAARMHAVRRKWPRRSPNKVGDVLVPPGADLERRATHVRHTNDARAGDPVQAHQQPTFDAHAMLAAIRETVEVLLTPIREQLDRERDRADRAEQQLTKVETELVKAQVETVGLRCQIAKAKPADSPKPDPPRWRRLLRALGHVR
jgi:hypothetical protein